MIGWKWHSVMNLQSSFNKERMLEPVFGAAPMKQIKTTVWRKQISTIIDDCLVGLVSGNVPGKMAVMTEKAVQWCLMMVMYLAPNQTMLNPSSGETYQLSDTRDLKPVIYGGIWKKKWSVKRLHPAKLICLLLQEGSEPDQWKILFFISEVLKEFKLSQNPEEMQQSGNYLYFLWSMIP